jgi:hypothetical protein
MDRDRSTETYTMASCTNEHEAFNNGKKTAQTVCSILGYRHTERKERQQAALWTLSRGGFVGLGFGPKSNILANIRIPKFEYPFRIRIKSFSHTLYVLQYARI